jgi:Toprim-like/Protein of unknown function (DUF3991)
MEEDELRSFKQSDALRQYAASVGFLVDRRESSRGCTVMRRDHEKIIISRKPDGVLIYWNVQNDQDRGSVIDFIQHRNPGLNLGAVRKKLRAFLNGPSPLPAFAALTKTTKDRSAVEVQFARMRPSYSHPYLETERGLPAALLQRERFAGTVRIDSRGNAVFPHYDQDGLCGYELKNKDYTSFASAGSKGIWSSNIFQGDERLVFCESGIDALSYGHLFEDEQMRVASVGGKLSLIQLELIRVAISRMPRSAEIVAAFDADKGGRDLAEVVCRAVELSGRQDLRFRIHEPVAQKDWNDLLRSRKRHPITAVNSTVPHIG